MLDTFRLMMFFPWALHFLLRWPVTLFHGSMSHLLDKGIPVPLFSHKD